MHADDAAVHEAVQVWLDPLPARRTSSPSRSKGTESVIPTSRLARWRERTPAL